MLLAENYYLLQRRLRFHSIIRSDYICVWILLLGYLCKENYIGFSCKHEPSSNTSEQIRYSKNQTLWDQQWMLIGFNQGLTAWAHHIQAFYGKPKHECFIRNTKRPTLRAMGPRRSMTWADPLPHRHARAHGPTHLVGQVHILRSSWLQALPKGDSSHQFQRVLRGARLGQCCRLSWKSVQVKCKITSSHTPNHGNISTESLSISS